MRVVGKGGLPPLDCYPAEQLMPWHARGREGWFTPALEISDPRLERG